MIGLKINLEGDGCWPELENNGAVKQGNFSEVALLGNGTEGGEPTVTIRVDLPNGETVLAQTTLTLFKMASDAMNARVNR